MEIRVLPRPFSTVPQCACLLLLLGSAVVFRWGSLFQHLMQLLHSFLHYLTDGHSGLAQHILVIYMLSLLLTSYCCLQLSSSLWSHSPFSLSESPSERRGEFCQFL